MTLNEPATIDDWLDIPPTMKDGVLTVRQFTISNFTELLRKIRNDSSLASWNHLYIYADNIIVNSSYNEKIVMTREKQFVTIIARELKVQGGLNFVTQEASDLLKIHLYIQNYTGSFLNCVAINDNSLMTLKPENLQAEKRLAYNKIITFDNETDDVEFIQDSKTFPLIWKIGSTFYWLLVQTFQEAYVKMQTEVETAINMFHWIGINAQLNWSEDTNHQMRSIGAQAAAMANYLGRPANIHYVPLLNLSTQIDTINAYLEDSRSIENKYNQFLIVTESFETRQSTAKLFKQEVDAKIQNTRNLISNAKNQLQEAQAKYKKNLENFQQQSSGLDKNKHEFPGPMAMARKELEEALEKKKDQATQDAVFGVIGAVVSLAGALGGGAAEGPAAVGKLAEVITQINKVIALVEKINKVVKTIESIMKLVDAIEKNQVLPDADFQISNIEDSEQLEKSDWQVLREQWDSGFNPYISDNILGSAMSNYRAEGRILFIYGEALTESRQSIAILQNTIAQLVMQVQVYQDQSHKIDDFVKLEQEDEEVYKQVAFLLRQQYFDVKRRLLVQLQDYKDAFRYWALQEPRNTGYDLKTDIKSFNISQIQNELNLAKQNLNRETAVICHISCDISDNAQDKSIGTVSQFKTWKDNNFARNYQPVFRIPIQLSKDVNPYEFNRYDRVRILQIEILFEGLENISANLQKVYHVNIINTGSYSDRLTNNDKSVYWNFTSQKHLSEEYSSHVRLLKDAEKSSSNRVVTMSPEAHSSFLTLETAQESNPLGGFYAPTVFTTWVITIVDAADNKSIDWFGVTSLKLRLYGTAMGSH